MFEPVHGSTADIAEQNIANPIGIIWAGAMYQGAHHPIMTAIEYVLRQGENLTRDMGGTANTQSLGEEIAGLLQNAGPEWY